MLISELLVFVKQLNKNVVIIETSLGIEKVLTPGGAVFDHIDTDDFRNFSVASGNLFYDSWGFANEEEAADFAIRCTLMQSSDKMLQLVWNTPPKKNHLRIVK